MAGLPGALRLAHVTFALNWFTLCAGLWPPPRHVAGGGELSPRRNTMPSPRNGTAHPLNHVKACVALELLGAVPNRRDGVEWAVIRKLSCLPYHGLRLPMLAAGLIECRHLCGDDGLPSNRY